MNAAIHQQIKVRVDALSARVNELKADVTRGLQNRNDDLNTMISEVSELMPDLCRHIDPARDLVADSLQQAEVMYKADSDERKRHEDKLKSNEERFRATFEQAAVGFAHISADGRWLRVNNKLCSMLGYSPGELISNEFNDIAHPGNYGSGGFGGFDAKTLTQALSEEVDNYKDNYKFERRCIRKDGVTLWVLVTASAIRGSTGDPPFLSCVIEDITQHKQAEQSLTESIRILSTAEQIAGTGGWEFDVDTGIISRSDELCRIIGIPAASETQLSNILDHIHSEDRDRMTAALNGAINECQPYICKYRLEKSDGKEIVLSVRGEPIVNEHGKVVRVIGSTQDVTANEEIDRALEVRRRMSMLSGDLGVALTRDYSLEKTLKRCAEALIEHLDASLVRIWTLHSVDNTLDLQASAGPLAHIPGGDSAIPATAAIHIGRIASERKPYVTNAFLNDPQIEGYEWAYRESIVAYAGIPLVVNKKLVGVLAVFSRYGLKEANIEALNSAADAIALGIQRCTAENELKRLNTDLEHIVGERTSQLQSALKELDAFSYSVSHDLRAPLRGIDGFSQALMSEFEAEMPEQAHFCLNRVRNSAQAMGRLIDDLLALSYLGRHPLNMQPVEMNSLAADVISDLQLLHGDRNVKIVTADLPICRCDPYLMRQVFSSLLANSFKYTSRKSDAQIEIGYKSGVGRQVFFVRDNGTGFDMKHAEKLFNAFERLDNEEDFGRDVSGSGIGLAIVQRIMNRHGGNVWAESTQGEGATFYIALMGDRR